MELIDKIVTGLQTSLGRGWKEFKESPLFVSYASLYDMLAPFFDIDLREVIPNPAYQLAAQQVAKYFMVKSREFGFSFDEVFPGNFEKSKESEGNDHEVRHFKMTTYRNNQLIGYLHLSFPHEHNNFDFPSSPRLEFEAH